MVNRRYPTFIPKRVLTLIQTFSGSFAEAEDTVKTIHNAKRKAEEQTGKHVVFEELVSVG
ncbi:hypothetical protein ACSFCM_17910 [Enterococcus gilvus]